MSNSNGGSTEPKEARDPSIHQPPLSGSLPCPAAAPAPARPPLLLVHPSVRPSNAMLSLARRPLSAAVPAGNLLGIHLFQCPVRTLPYPTTSIPLPRPRRPNPFPFPIVSQTQDAVGIVAKLSECIASRGGNIHSVDVFVPDDKPIFYSRRYGWMDGWVAACLFDIPVSSPTTQGSGRVMSSTTISSISPAASMHKHPPYEYPILTPNTTSPSSHQSRLVSFLSFLCFPALPFRTT